MNLTEYLAYLRSSVLHDVVVPYFWSDEVIVSRLNEGMRRFAVRTHMLVDDDRTISLTAGVSTYDLGSDVVFVYSVQLNGQSSPLSPSTEGWTPEDNIQTLPSRYTLDKKSRSIRFYPTPDTAYTATLRIARLPVAASLTAPNDVLEIDEPYDLVPADWVAHRCFSDPDADTFAPGEADRALARFNLAVNEGKRDTYRLRTASTARAHGLRIK